MIRKVGLGPSASDLSEVSLLLLVELGLAAVDLLKLAFKVRNLILET